MSPRLLLAASCLVSSFGAPPVLAQCANEWLPGFASPVPDGPIQTAVEFDDGTGNALYVAGRFGEVGGVAASLVARRTPTQGWSALGSGLQVVPLGTQIGVTALAVYDDGRGPALYATGNLAMAGGVPVSGIARWDGTSWEALGAGLGGALNDVRVHSMCVHDDGSGSKLYVGGNFASAGGVPASKLARWDGTNWESVGAGIDGPQGNTVYALASYYDAFSNTSMLFVGGDFPGAIGVPSPSIVRWNGTSYEPAVGGANGIVYALRVYDDGSGAQLYAGGTFTTVGSVASGRAARWNGETWSAFGTTGTGGLGAFGAVRSFGVRQTTSGPVLHIGGNLTLQGLPTSTLASWDGTSLVPVAGGPTLGGSGAIEALVEFDTDSGRKLLVGGSYTVSVEGAGRYALAYDGSNWAPFCGAPGGVTAAPSTSSPEARAFLTVDHGGAIGTRSYVAGRFTVAGNVFARHVAVLGETGFTSIGGVTKPSDGNAAEVSALASYDFGSGEELVVAGHFTHADGSPAASVARYDGAAWQPIAGSPITTVRTLVVHDEGLGAGEQLFLCGIGGPAGVARFDGTNWVVLPSTFVTPKAMASFDDGAGPALYVACNSSACSGDARVQRWNGVAWTSATAGLEPFELLMNFVVHDRGNGPELFASSSAGALRAWDGTQWSVQVAVGSAITALASFDDGSGPSLFLAGAFTNLGGPFGDRLARWDGVSFFPLGGGSSGPANAFGTLSIGGQQRLAIGGWAFSSVQNQPSGENVLSAGLAFWGSPCPSPGVAFCSGDGSATACPCGNAGASGHGCANSFDASGAELVASGVPRVSADTFVLDASGVSNSTVTFLQGTLSQNGGNGSVFGDGLRCAGGSLIRLGSAQASGNAATYPTGVQQPVSIRGALPPLGNVTRTYQVWYRNSVPFCTPAVFNLTNGVRTYWAP